MLRKILLVSLFCLTSSFADFLGINPAQLQDKIKQNIVVIDIRTPEEWLSTGVVPSSKKIMFFDKYGKYDVQSWIKQFSQHVKDPNQAFVLVCRSGNRTGQVGTFLSQQLKYKNVYHLQNGIKSWIKENRKVVK